MKQSLKSMLGVTLLEIMLVLAIAAMVIVMSVKYYQGATSNAKVNIALEQVSGIVASVQSYLATSGTLSGMTSGALQPYMAGGKIPFSPWGGALLITGISSSQFTIIIPAMPGGGTCTTFTGLINQNSKWAVSGTCGTASSASAFTITVTE